jgi:hypothetical protein
MTRINPERVLWLVAARRGIREIRVIREIAVPSVCVFKGSEFLNGDDADRFSRTLTP